MRALGDEWLQVGRDHESRCPAAGSAGACGLRESRARRPNGGAGARGVPRTCARPARHAYRAAAARRLALGAAARVAS